MLHNKFIFTFILAVLFFSKCAFAEDDDDNDDHQANDTFEHKICTISYPKHKKMQLYAMSFWHGRKISVKRFDKEDNNARWIVTPFKRAGKIFYEIKNKATSNTLGAKENFLLKGDFDLVRTSGSMRSLWELSSDKPGSAITLKNVDNEKYLMRPKHAEEPMRVGDKPEPWAIKCN
jgi:hypothetical protein